jgi:hypothetical protein
VREKGHHQIVFDPRQHGLAEGMYVCWLQAGASIASWKLVVTD